MLFFVTKCLQTPKRVIKWNCYIKRASKPKSFIIRAVYSLWERRNPLCVATIESCIFSELFDCRAFVFHGNFIPHAYHASIILVLKNDILRCDDKPRFSMVIFGWERFANFAESNTIYTNVRSQNQLATLIL